MADSYYGPLLERVAAEENAKYKTERERVKAVKRRLHALHGAYLNESAHKKVAALLEGLCAECENSSGEGDADTATGDDGSARLIHTAETILRLHASTRERLPYISDLYDYIFRQAGEVRTILDIGCGYNPFSIPWMPRKPEAYHACDIDLRAAGLINRFLTATGLPQTAFLLDAVAETPAQTADVALLFKLLPVLEAQRKGRGFALLTQINVRCAAVTYPLKSLSGREKGMGAHYAKIFEDALDGALSPYTLAGKETIGNELVYILHRTETRREHHR